MDSGNTPLVTVVTAAFRALPALRRTVESVAAQSCRDVEHVVVDGGSDDGTSDYLASLGEGVRWLSEPDKGIADAMNKGLAMARGQYVLVLQAGDTFRDGESLASAVPHLDGADMVNFDVLFVKPDGREEVLPARPISLATEFRLLNPHQGLFTHRRVFERIGAFDENVRMVMDYDHMLRAKHAADSA